MCRDTAGLRRAAAIPRLARLCLLSLVALCCAQSSTASGQQPAQSPTPSTRPRTVGAKVGAPPPATQTDSGATQQPERGNSQPSQEAVDDDEVVRVISNLVIIPASVVDGNGRAVTDLKADDFELKVDGEVKPIGDLSRAETPVNVALLFDNSASLSTAREFEKQAAVRFFQSVIRPIDRAAVYSISTNSTLAQGLTNDVPRLVRTIQNFGKPDGATALFDAVTQASDYMRPLQGRKVLIIVSDGTDTVSDASFEDAVGRALLAECQVYVVQTHQVEDPSLHDTVSEQRMWKLSDQTGGAVFTPQSVDDLDNVFSQISLDISQQYLLSYYPQDERKDNFFRFISLRVKTRPNTRVRARKGFYPASAQVPPHAAAAASELTGGFSRVSGVGGNSSPAANDGAAAQKRADAGARPSGARRGDASGRKVGPDGPDDDRAKQAANADDSAPTFTVTAVASSTQPKESASPEPTPSPTTAQETAAQPQPSTQPSPAPSNEQSTSKDADVVRPRDPVLGGVMNGRALSLPPPVYPAAARSAGIWGTVVVEVLIDERGKVAQARALSGHPWLQQSAVSAARLARFTPAVLNGQPVSIKGTINYDFLRP
ncbi:MAG TPA: VWA domain-containing protein [Pyrinomonadaceae bacterium]|nr:VWA domain-containing protein [Pyrinomonadaceae bacterium]